MSPSNENSRRSLWPVFIIGFFAVAIAGCVGFVVFCNLHPTDLVAEDYYEQELRYQAQLDRMNRARALPGQARIGFEPATRQIIVTLPIASPGETPAGSIQLYRPSAAGLDRKFALNTTAEGRQTIDATQLDPGLWRVKVTWTAGAREYYADQDVVIGGKGS